MIGRLYLWRGAVWLLQVRAEPFVAAPGMGPMRNVLIERVELLAGQDPRAVMHGTRLAWRDGRWWLQTGERVVRPFRGLRRWRP